MPKKAITLGLVLLLVACAKAPESIAPAYVSQVSYQSWTCTQLQEEGSRLSNALVEASTQQRNARTNDTLGIIFIGLPVSSLSGDNIAPQVANLKGQIIAVQTAGNLKNCGFQIAMQQEAPKETVPAPKADQTGFAPY